MCSGKAVLLSMHNENRLIMGPCRINIQPMRNVQVILLARKSSGWTIWITVMESEFCFSVVLEKDQNYNLYIKGQGNFWNIDPTTDRKYNSSVIKRGAVHLSEFTSIVLV